MMDSRLRGNDGGGDNEIKDKKFYFLICEFWIASSVATIFPRNDTTPPNSVIPVKTGIQKKLNNRQDDLK
jgi:hypothetical protein